MPSLGKTTSWWPHIGRPRRPGRELADGGVGHPAGAGLPDAAGSPAHRGGVTRRHRRRTSRPVSRVLCARSEDRAGDHPSRAAVADSLLRSTRELGRAALERSLSDLAPGGVCRAARVTPGAGGLLHHRFTLTAVARGAAVCSLWHCPAGHPGWVLPTTLPCGARTFLGEQPESGPRRGRPAGSSAVRPGVAVLRPARTAPYAGHVGLDQAAPARPRRAAARPRSAARTAGSASCTVPPPASRRRSTTAASNSCPPRPRSTAASISATHSRSSSLARRSLAAISAGSRGSAERAQPGTSVPAHSARHTSPT